MAQSVKKLTLDFDSGHDLTVSRVQAPRWALRWAWNLLKILSFSLSLSLCLSPSAPPPLAYARSLSLKKKEKEKKILRNQ